MYKLVFLARLSALALMFATPITSSAQDANTIFYGIQMEELEYRFGDSGEKRLVWDGDAFFGTDELKLRWLGAGELDTKTNAFETLENRLVVQFPVSEFFDLKGGARLDTPAGPDRWYAVFGITGLAKQWFEIDADLFIGRSGDVSARLDVEYELLLTNRLILIPSAEIDFAFSDDLEIGVGSGLVGAEVGVRLSYDLIDRALSPYVGIVYERSFGRTAVLARSDGDQDSTWFAVFGFKLMF